MEKEYILERLKKLRAKDEVRNSKLIKKWERKLRKLDKE